MTQTHEKHLFFLSELWETMGNEPSPPERLHKIDAVTKNLDFIEVFCYI